MKTIYIFLVMLLTAGTITAQTGTMTGRIIDDASFPLIGAYIDMQDVGGTVTDENGYYILTGISVGSHSATISYIGYDDTEITFDIAEGEVLENNIVLKQGLTLQEVVISSTLGGQAKALNTQLTNNNITNVIAADQIGRFPDNNIGDAMKRIPGINVQYDQGEARFGNIRGTAPQLSSVMINGERIPSAEAEDRTVQLDLVPADMVQSVEVSKAVTPDMDADAIGGAVNLVTRAAPSQQRISATVGSGYNLVANKPSTNLALVYGNRFADDKVGLIVSGSFFNNHIGSDNVEAEWNGDNIDEFQMRQYYLQRARQSYSASLDFKLAPAHTIFIKGIYNQRDDWENRYRTVFKKFKEKDGKWSSKIERQTKGGIKDNKFGRLEAQDVINLSLSGEHAFGKLRVDWSGNFARASEKRPHERYFEYGSDDREAIKIDIADKKKPLVSAVDAKFQKPTTAWKINEIIEEEKHTSDRDINGKISFGYQVSNGRNASIIKAGLRTRKKTKERNNDFYEYKPKDKNATLAESLKHLKSQSKSGYLVGDKYKVGEFVSREYLGNLNLADKALFKKKQDLSELAGNFNATESINAGYLMLEQSFGDNIKVLAGLRAELTSLEYQGYTYQEEDEENGLEESLTKTGKSKSNYSNILPGIHVKYNLNKRTVVKAAWSNTLARPNYFDLVPYREIAEGNELSIGNPELKATTSSNFDVMLEHYFGTIGVVSGGVFMKNIKDFIVTQRFKKYTFEGKTWDKFAQPINGGNANLLGLELAFQRQLDFIAPELKGLGVYLNYTYTASTVTDFNFEGREKDKLSLPGSPQNTLNASLSYEGKRFTSRLSYNFASEFIDEVGDKAATDRYYDSVNYLDLNFGYNINRNFNIYFNVNNILNQPLRYFQGEKAKTMQVEYYNMRFDLGVKYDLYGGN